MAFNIFFVLTGIVAFASGGWKFALAIMGFLFFLFLTLAIVRELFFMVRYRKEFLACSSAVIANNEAMADEVNCWTHHYYVHKSFYMVGHKGGLDCGYKLSVRDRPRRAGGGYQDTGFVSFGV